MIARQEQPLSNQTDDESDLDLGDDNDFPETAEISGGTEDEVKKAFDRDLRDARDFARQTFANDKEKKKAQMEFVKIRQEGWKRQTEKERRNFLHVLAYYDHTQRPTLQWLMVRAILKLPELMRVLDSSKRTPLTVALSVGNEMFVHATCKNVTDETRKRIGEYLKAECVEHDNDREITCLHVAISANFKPELTAIIISFVPEEMFSVVDFKGRTPLHLAVEFDKCCKTQISIVTQLLHRGPAALDVRTLPDLWKRTHSVFQHHENTRRAAENTSQARNAMKKRQEDAKRADRETDAKIKEAVEMTTAPTKSLHGHGEPRSTAAPGRAIIETGGHGIGGKSFAPGAASPVPHGSGKAPPPLLRVATVNLEGAGGNESGSRGPSSPSTAKGMGPPIDREQERGESADEIKEMLKMVYLRVKKPHEAAHYLHIQDEKGILCL